jgi:hypothetical protein
MSSNERNNECTTNCLEDWDVMLIYIGKREGLGDNLQLR